MTFDCAGTTELTDTLEGMPGVDDEPITTVVADNSADVFKWLPTAEDTVAVVGTVVVFEFTLEFDTEVRDGIFLLGLGTGDEVDVDVLVVELDENIEVDAEVLENEDAKVCVEDLIPAFSEDIKVDVDILV